MSLLKKLGAAVRKVGRAIDPTMSGSIGNKLVGAIPVVGKVAQTGLTVVGELNKSKPASPVPSPVPPPQPSPTPPVNTGGVGAKMAPANVSQESKTDGKKWAVIAGVAGAVAVLAFALTGRPRRRR